MVKQGLMYLYIVAMMGCSSKEMDALNKEYSEKRHSYKLLQNTERVQFKENGMTKILLTATYMSKNNTNNKKHLDEIFLIGLYDAQSDVESLGTPRLSLLLNGKVPLNIKHIDKDNVHLTNISFNADWNQFYEVHFPYLADYRLKLKINSNQFKTKILSFSKVAKYQL